MVYGMGKNMDRSGFGSPKKNQNQKHETNEKNNIPKDERVDWPATKKNNKHPLRFEFRD